MMKSDLIQLPQRTKRISALIRYKDYEMLVEHLERENLSTFIHDLCLTKQSLGLDLL